MSLVSFCEGRGASPSFFLRRERVARVFEERNALSLMVEDEAVAKIMGDKQ